MLVPHLILGYQERRMFAPRKFMKFVMLRLVYEFIQFSLSSALIKQALNEHIKHLIKNNFLKKYLKN